MSTPPARPKIYHITHIDNLPKIIQDGGLKSDSMIASEGGPLRAIGMSLIKLRRLSLPVDCHRGTHVGDYVPFYFCPRSVMLYIIYQGNHPELDYKGGQGPIVHLEADLLATIEWADEERRLWAFSLSNAGSYYAQFRDSASKLNEIDWNAIGARDFRDQGVKEGKQAEFLLLKTFPWELVNRIGISSSLYAPRAHSALDTAVHKPIVEVRTDWYF